jgi:hypothetical protein
MVYSFLSLMLPELTDLMAMEVREWRSELRAAVNCWKGGSQEPDWQAFRLWLNEICYEDGMPALFPTEEG